MSAQTNTSGLAHIDPGAGWDELIPLDEPRLQPLDLDCLPGWAGAYARALAAHTETPPELAAAMILAACSTAAARRLRVRVEQGYFEPANLWLVAALPPGTRKSAVQNAACGPLVAWERDQAELMKPEIQRISSERSTQEERARELRKKAAKEKDHTKAKEMSAEVAEIEAELPDVPKPPQLWSSDVTVEKLGVLLAEHCECMAWLSSEGGIFDLLEGRYSNGNLNLDLVLKSHSGDPERVDRGSRPPVHLHRPRLTVGLSPQPDVLRGLASKPGFRGRGLLGRFLYFLPRSAMGYRHLTPVPVPEGVQAAYTAGLRAMLDWNAATDEQGAPRPHVLRLSREAYSDWKEFQRKIETTMRPAGLLEHCTDWGGKAPGAAARLAGVLHGIRHAHGEPWQAEIDRETMLQALEIIGVSTHHALAAFDLMGADPTVAAARELWEWVKRGRHRTFTKREAHQQNRSKFPRAADVEKAIEVLEERGYVRQPEEENSGGRRGRPSSPMITVRPSLTEGW